MTYDEAVAYLESFVNYERAPQPAAMRTMTLERMRSLCRRLGDPQRSFRSILVTGTNGKGSICAMLYSMLRESTLRVGLYTSPHLEHLRERIRVWTSGPVGERLHGDDWIPEAEFAALVERLRPVLEDMRRAPAAAPPTHFEVLTAIAFLYFRQRRVEIAVLEVGLGGRLDATNVVDQTVSVIAPIDVDHADILGADPVSVAREKAGVIKPNQLVLSARQPEGVMEVLRAAAEEQGVSVLVAGRDVSARVLHHGVEGLRVSLTGLRGIYESLELPLIGRHQAENAALAVGALEACSSSGIPRSLVERGLSRVEWPGRLEVVSEAPLVIMDGAHNPHAASALVQTLTELCPGRTVHFLIGMSSDKAVEETAKILGPVASSATCTKSQHPRALDPAVLAERLAPWCPETHVLPDAVDAYTVLLNAVADRDVIVVTGSLFLVGELRSAIRRSRVHARRPGELQAA
jgi:dihydrofolate synthase/folylpolyglutamate synthase